MPPPVAVSAAPGAHRDRPVTRGRYGRHVIRIELDDASLARTRIAISPLWEAITSLLLLQRSDSVAGAGGLGFPYTRWEIRARTVLADQPDWLAYLFRASAFPDFLGPVPRSPVSTFEEEIARVRITPRETIEAQLAGYRDASGHDDPLLAQLQRPGELDRFADGMTAYWHACLEPLWPAMRAALDDEVLNRARALASAGPSAFLADLHERLVWEEPILTLIKHTEAEISARERRLVLIPLIFSRGALMCSSDESDVIGVSYQARGAAVLDQTPRTDVGDRLAVLLGSGRAQVLRALATPATTAGLAAALGLAPSTVSEHLSVLHASGVAYRRRTGRRVLYGLEPVGLALVGLIGADPDEDSVVAKSFARR